MDWRTIKRNIKIKNTSVQDAKRKKKKKKRKRNRKSENQEDPNFLIGKHPLNAKCLLVAEESQEL